jgi:hypothetical protein
MSGPERNISVVKGKENNEKKTYQHISRARTGTAGTLLLLPPLLPLLLAAIAAVDVDAAVAVVVVVAVLPLLLPLLQLMGVVVVVVVERYVELAVTSGEEINKDSRDLLRVGSNDFEILKNSKSFEPTLNKSHDLWLNFFPLVTAS